MTHAKIKVEAKVKLLDILKQFEDTIQDEENKTLNEEFSGYVFVLSDCLSRYIKNCSER